MSATRPDISIDVARGAADAAGLTAAWRGVLREAPAATLNADPDYLAATTDETLSDAGAAPAAPYLALLRRGDVPCGVIAGRTTRTPFVPRVGYARLPMPRLRRIEVVYGGLVDGGCPEVRSAVAGHLRTLLDTGEAEHVVLHKLRAESAYRDLLGAARPVAEPFQPHWWTDLVPGSIEQTLARHKSEHRKKLRRFARRLSDRHGGDVELLVATGPDDARRFLVHADAIARRSYHGGLGTGLVNDARWRSMLTALAAQGRFRGYVLLGGGVPLAYQNGLVHGDRFIAWGTAYDAAAAADRPGTVLMLRVLEDLCGADMRTLDWSFGDAEYKRIYGTGHREEGTLHLYGRSPRARLARGLHRAALAAGRLGTERSQHPLVLGLKRRWRRALTAPVSPSTSPPAPTT